jgi:hypothetical protein
MNDMTIEELREELDRREREARLEQSTKEIERFHKIMNYSMVALWGIVIGSVVTMCATHLK